MAEPKGPPKTDAHGNQLPGTANDPVGAFHSAYGKFQQKYNPILDSVRSRYGLNKGGGKRGGGGGGGGSKSKSSASASVSRGGGPAGPPKKPKPSAWADTEKMIKDRFTGILSGDIKRYGPEWEEGQKSKLWENTLGGIKSQVKMADAGNARRGVFRSGLGSRTERDLRSAGLKAFTQGMRDVMLQKMDKEFEDKNTALSMAQQWMTGKQNYDLGKERNVIAREQIAQSAANAALSAQVQREGIRAANGRARAALSFQQDMAAQNQANWEYQQSRDLGASGFDYGGPGGRGL